MTGCKTGLTFPCARTIHLFALKDGKDNKYSIFSRFQNSRRNKKNRKSFQVTKKKKKKKKFFSSELILIFFFTSMFYVYISSFTFIILQFFNLLFIPNFLYGNNITMTSASTLGQMGYFHIPADHRQQLARMHMDRHIRAGFSIKSLLQHIQKLARYVDPAFRFQRRTLLMY